MGRSRNNGKYHTPSFCNVTQILFVHMSQDNEVMQKVMVEGLSALTITEVSALLAHVGMKTFIKALAEEEVGNNGFARVVST